MSNENGKVEIDTKLNTEGVDKGIKGLTNKLNKLADNKTLTAFSKLGNAVTGLSSAFSIVTNTIKSVNAAIADLTNSYATQRKAEIQLETAVRNNPYLSNSSIKTLKEYASQLQSVGTVGDEELIPMMAQLAAAGRTQDEIMQIMSASLDIAASGSMSLDSAVRNLNKTFGGYAGELGESIPEIKNLTTEELKQGKAVDILAQKYKGMAEDVADATGGTQQLANAWGDFKEIIGEGFMTILNPIAQTIATIVSKINGVLGAYHSLSKNASANEIDQREIEKATQLKSQAQQSLEIHSKQLEDVQKLHDKNVADIRKKTNERNKKLNEQRIAQEDEALRKIQKLYNDDVANVEKYDDEITAAQKRIDNRDAETKKALEGKPTTSTTTASTSTEAPQKTAKETYAETLAQLEAEIAARASVGQAMDKETEAQTRLNTMLNAYIAAIQSGEISANDTWIDDTTDAIKKQAEAYKKAKDAADKAAQTQAVVDKWSIAPTEDELTQLQKELDILEAQAKALGTESEEGQKVADAIKNCKQAIEDAKNAAEQADFDKLMNNILSVVNTVSSSLSSLSDSIQQVTETKINSIEKETESETDDLKTQLEQGIIDYDTYYEQKEELEKKAAQKEYKLQMAQWTMNLATATAQCAQAVLGALADTTVSSYTVKVLNSVAAGLIGAAQIATIAGNKPTAPSFSTGGFLLGNSTSGDKIAFNGNAGEAILNPAEQRNFMDLANGNAGVNISMPVSIVNNAGDSVSVSATQNTDGLRVTIEKIVNAGLAAGTFNDGLNAAQSNMQGAKYL